jgi:hypothetical protein
MPSYTTITEAKVYFNDRLNVNAWECATNDQRRRALAQATQIIDRLNFSGCPTEPDTTIQTNQFPRDGDLVIPGDIKNATSEIALALLDGVDPEVEYENLTLRSQAYGGLKAEHHCVALSDALSQRSLRN